MAEPSQPLLFWGLAIAVFGLVAVLTAYAPRLMVGLLGIALGFLAISSQLDPVGGPLITMGWCRAC